MELPHRNMKSAEDQAVATEADEETAPVPRFAYSILAVIMAIFCLSSVVLNTTVIWVTIRHRQLRQPINYALVNLAVADLGVTVSGGLLTAITNSMGYFSLGRAGCVIEGFSVAFFGIVALCTVAVIAVDRFVIVCKPLGIVHFHPKHAVMGVAFAWIWSLIWNIPPLFGWGSYQLEGVKTSCAPDWKNPDPLNMSYIMCYFCLCFAIPFIIIMPYLIIGSIAHGGTTAKAEAKVARMVIVMILAFLICWLPYAAFSLAVVFNSQFYIHPLVATVPMYLAKTSTVYNPIIYIFMNTQVRGFSFLPRHCTYFSSIKTGSLPRCQYETR
uniref:Parapinopsin a n=1 Tax=Erpetoichthys calabaricus TaxID=27687 RepID=A0A8C4TJ21_ERPCA